MNTPTPAPTGTPSPVRVDNARLADTDAYLQLIAMATPGQPAPPAIARDLTLPPDYLLTHGRVCLVVRDTHRHPIGALLASVPHWVHEHPACAGTPLPGLLQHLVVAINAIAVHPDHRQQGLARKLIRAAERRLTHTGYQLITLEHAPPLSPFYDKLGYLSDPHLLMTLPKGNLLAVYTTGLLSAVKPLTGEIDVVRVPGAPARIVSGILGHRVPPTARFTNGRLIH